MKNKITIAVFEVVGSPLCVASSDGQKVYKRLATALTEKYNVVLSFNNVTALTTAFLNTAVGQLYGKFSEKKIRDLLEVSNMENEDLMLLKQIVDTAKQYFKDPKKFDQVIRTNREDG